MKTSFKKSLIAAAILGFTAVGVGGAAFAAGGKSDHKMKHMDWGFNGWNGTYDQAAVQRGFQVYTEVCAACHALEHLSFRHLGEKGGPFFDPKHPNPNDNNVVKAIAKSWMVTDIDQETGDEIERTAIPADKFPEPFANPAAARASNGGALPPDLSVIVKARNGGADYLYDILMSYGEAPSSMDMGDGMYYNPAFEGAQIGMAPPLAEGLIEYQAIEHDDGHGHKTSVAAYEPTTEQMAKDITEFLAWTADPKMEERKKMGLGVMLFLLIFAGLMWLTYRQVWKDVEH